MQSCGFLCRRDWENDVATAAGVERDAVGVSGAIGLTLSRGVSAPTDPRDVFGVASASPAARAGHGGSGVYDYFVRPWMRVDSEFVTNGEGSALANGTRNKVPYEGIDNLTGVIDTQPLDFSGCELGCGFDLHASDGTHGAEPFASISRSRRRVRSV